MPASLGSLAGATEPVRGVYAPAAGVLQSGAWLLIALPALGAAVLLLGGRRTDRWGHWLAVGLSWAAFVWGALLFIDLLSLDPAQRSRDLHLFDWIPAGSFQLSAGLLLDPLSVTFVLLVTFVGSLILVYAVAYMEHDHDRRRFFAYLNLFVASMLLLVLADSYLLLFVGWEGVGLASYLLIGFWNYNTDYAGGAEKAVVAHRIGDLREEGVRRQPHRRPRAHHRARPDVRDVRRRGLRHGAGRGRRLRQPGH